MISIPRQAQKGKGRGAETQVGTAAATATSKELFSRSLHVFRNNLPAYTNSFLLSLLPNDPPIITWGACSSSTTLALSTSAHFWGHYSHVFSWLVYRHIRDTFGLHWSSELILGFGSPSHWHMVNSWETERWVRISFMIDWTELQYNAREPREVDVCSININGSLKCMSCKCQWDIKHMRTYILECSNNFCQSGHIIDGQGGDGSAPSTAAAVASCMMKLQLKRVFKQRRELCRRWGILLSPKGVFIHSMVYMCI